MSWATISCLVFGDLDEDQETKPFSRLCRESESESSASDSLMNSHSRKNNHKNNCPHRACGTKKPLPGHHRLICSCFDKCRVDIFTKMVFLVSFSYVLRCFSYVPSINIRWIDEGPLKNLFIMNSSILPCGVLHHASLHYSFPRQFMISVCHDSNS